MLALLHNGGYLHHGDAIIPMENLHHISMYVFIFYLHCSQVVLLAILTILILQ